MASISRPDWSQLRSIDLDLVRAFVAVVDCGGFTAAAKHLHRTQSTISLRIRTLEERLETNLFLRNSRRLALSRNGENFLIHARRLIQVQNEAIAALTEGTDIQVVRFGLPEDYAEFWLPELIKNFHERRPHVRPHIHCGTSLELLERLQAGELDLALVVRHGSMTGGRSLGQEQVVWAAHADFRLSPDSPAPLALFPETCCYRQRGLAALTAIGRAYNVIYTSQSPTGIKVAVNHGAAVTIIDKRTLPANWRLLSEADGFPPLPPAELELHRATGLRDDAIEDLISIIETMVESRRQVTFRDMALV